MVTVEAIEAGSIAEELGIGPGDHLISINGSSINDRLDYRFFIADEQIELLVKQAGSEVIFEIEKDIDEDPGLIIEEMKMKACGNNCVFCFVYQNPKGMRKALYFKDEDYRFSFLYGHYVTMTTLKQKDLDRIVEQRLSPLYISVHSTEEKTRKLLLGIKRDDHLLEKIEFLTGKGIELHTQIVLVPGINDGEIFDRTVSDLKAFYPGVKSVAVVPVGLTQHRENLMTLRMHQPGELNEMIQHVDRMRAGLRKELGDAFVYLSDEFFIKAEQEMPSAEYYDAFYQIENGVGEFRAMIDELEAAFSSFPKKFDKKRKVTWVTGTLVEKPLDKYIISKLRSIGNLEIQLIAIHNHFYGPSIEISGLLVGADIFVQLKKHELGELVLLPPRVLNDDNLFLDDWTVGKLSDSLGVPCHVYTEPLDQLINIIKKHSA